MNRARILLLVALPLGCRGTFDIGKYQVAGTETGEGSGTGTSGESTTGTSEESGTVGETETDTDPTETETDTDPTETETDTDPTDTDGPCEADLGTVCLGVRQIVELGVGTPNDIAVADFLLDPGLDLLVTGTPVVLWRGSGTGEFTDELPIVDTSAVGLAVTNFAGDGTPDFAAIAADQVEFYASNGDGTFNLVETIMPGGHDGVFGELSGDANDDFVVSGDELRVYTNSGGWLLTDTHAVVGLGLALGRFDLDDALPDVALAMSNVGRVGVYRNLNDGTVFPPYSAELADVTDVATIDFNGNARELLAVAGTRLFVYQTNEGPNLGVVEDHAVGANPRAVAVGDIDGDGVPDAAVANATSRDISVLLGVGFGLSDEFRVSAPAGDDIPESILVVDLDFDNQAEVVVGMLGSNRVVVYGGV